MTSKTRASVYTVGILAVVAFGLVDFACSGSDTPTADTTTGGSSATPGSGGTSSGGTTSKATGGTANGVGGTSATNTGGTAAALTGGASAIATGGSPVVSTGGAPTGGSPAVSTGGAPTGGQVSTGGIAPTGGTASIVTGGTAAVATGGTPAVGTGGDTSMTTGGTTSVATGGDTSVATGGDTSAATGGDTSTGGTSSAATGGTSASGGTSTATCGPFTPPTLPGTLCSTLTTAAGPAPAKNGACTTADPQLCYSTCGPAKMGYKSETCGTPTAGVYNESACTFPGTDYSCFKIPTTYDASCPAVPHSGDNCTTLGLAAGTVCGPTYTSSSSSTPANGYCICNNNGTNITFSCASTSAWPCPNGAGCT